MAQLLCKAPKKAEREGGQFLILSPLRVGSSPFCSSDQPILEDKITNNFDECWVSTNLFQLSSSNQGTLVLIASVMASPTNARLANR